LVPGSANEDTKNQTQAAAGSTIAGKDFSRHLGHDVLTLEDQHVLLKIKWSIAFDWTVEAESEAEAEVEPASSL
jgi:hypothetical protein